MSEQRKSLFNASISIRSIRSSVTQFSKSLQRSGVIAADIAKRTRQTNIFNEGMISKEDEFFRKRRENVRRKNREDELESSSISGVTKKEGNIITRSTRGFLGRILDFFGIILIGWFVTKLPAIIKAIGNTINLIKRAVGFLKGYVDGLREFLTTIGNGIRGAIDALPKGFDFLKFKKESDDILNETENRAQKTLLEFQVGFKGLARDIVEGQSDPDIDPSTGLIYYGDEIEQRLQGASGGQGQDQFEVMDGETDDSNNITGVSTMGVEEDNLEVEKDPSEEESIQTLKKIDKESDRMKNIKDGKDSEVSSKVKESMSGLEPGGGGGAPGSSGAPTTGLTSGSESESKKNDKKGKPIKNRRGRIIGYEKVDESETNEESGGVKLDQSSKKRREVVIYRGDEGSLKMIKGVGIDALSKDEAISNYLKLKEKNNDRTRKEDFRFRSLGILLNDKFNVNTRVIQSNVKLKFAGRTDDMNLITVTGKDIPELEKIFKDDRPTIIIQDADTGNGFSEMVNMPPLDSTKIDFEFKEGDGVSLKKIHSLMLDN